jgi:hypothetical protein
VAAAACAVAAQVPEEVADFAEALEAFFVPPFLKAAPGVLPAAAAPAFSGPQLAAVSAPAAAAVSAFAAKAFARAKAGHGARAALPQPSSAAVVQAQPLAASMLRLRYSPALSLIQWGGAVARTLSLLAGLLSVLFGRSTGSSGGGPSQNNSSASAAAGNWRPASSGVL